jgi:2,3-dihydroxybenzoate decarboxylase
VKKIALEEHFMTPGMEPYWKTTMGSVDPKLYGRIIGQLFDFGEMRLAAMDRAGIEIAALGLAGPGVQIERDAAVATRGAAEANDFLARAIAPHPQRYRGLAHLAMQDPVGAAMELERCIRDLGFAGAMINGHTNGQYLDDPALYPFWQRVQEMNTIIYLHPTDPVATYPAIVGCDSIKRAMWEWGVETGTHALRLVFNGLFDRFPNIRLVLGHLGETLPFLLWRFDSRAKLYGLKLRKRPSDYIRENIWVTTSGMFSADPVMCSVSALGRDRVLFSADYPFENSDEAGEFMQSLPVDEELRADIAYRNAERLLGLPRR